jgi:phosphoglycolate phosphatase-like HAD superfamily hydrolase
MIRLVLFDIDGTLVRTGGAGVKAFGRTFASEFNLGHGTERISFAGRTDTGLVKEFFRLHQIEPTAEHLDRFFNTYYFWLDQLLGELRGAVCPGARELIHELRSLPDPPTLGLLTGNVRLGAEIKLRQYDLWHLFETGGFGDDHEDRNEIARIAHQRGSHRMGRTLHGDEVLVIGDTPLDIACANAISARCLAVATGGSTLQQLKEHHPRWAVPDLKAVSARELCA